MPYYPLLFCWLYVRASVHGLLKVYVTQFVASSPCSIMHSSNEPCKQSSQLADSTEHERSAMIIEDVLVDIIPFLTMETPAHTLCDPKPGWTPMLRTGEHAHIWCHRCANLPDRHHCAATHNACEDCTIIRTIIQLSRRWDEFMWERFPDQHESC